MTFEEKLALAIKFNKDIEISKAEITSLKADFKSSNNSLAVVKDEVAVIKAK